MHQTVITAAALVLSALAGGALAQSYTLEPNHTFPSIEFKHLQMSTFRGKFTRTTGKVVLDRAAGTGTVDVTIDPASIDFGVPAMNANARGSDWFNVGQFPTITYKGTISRFDGDRPAQVDGELTMLGVTRPVRLQMTSFRCMQHAVLKREMCGGDATGVLDRRDFGLRPGTPSPVISDQIRIVLQAVAVRDQ